MFALVRISTAGKKHHDHGNTFEKKIDGVTHLPFRVLVYYCHGRKQDGM